MQVAQKKVILTKILNVRTKSLRKMTLSLTNQRAVLQIEFVKPVKRTENVKVKVCNLCL